VSRFVLNSDSKTEVDNDGHIPYRKAVQAEAGTSFLPANRHSYFRESSRIVELFFAANNLSLEMDWNKVGEPELSSLHLI
jgi:hypothetical protein